METVLEMEKLKAEGKIRAIGVSNWMEPEWEELGEAARIEVLQPCYSLLWRSVEAKVLGLCREHEIALIPYAPLCQGILAGRFKTAADLPSQAGDPRLQNVRLKPEQLPGTLKVVRALEEVAASCGKTPAQTALRWLLDQPGVSAPIVGASSPQQLDENLGALGWKLDPADWKRLDKASRALSIGLKAHDSLWNWHPREM